MKILVVGGTGLIGGHAALHLHSLGHEVSIAARSPPPPSTSMTTLNFVRLDYIADAPSRRELSGFDSLVFAAGNDIRHLPKGADEAMHWQRANSEAIPRFFGAAREAGIRTAIHLGSFYPQQAPWLIATNDYIRSRHLADEGARALARSDFRVISINAPYVVGAVRGVTVPYLRALTQYAEGQMAALPRFAPPGGVNVMSTRSLSEAITGALFRGRSGAAYLVGDENMTFQAFMAAFLHALGNHDPIPIRDEDHPLLGSYAGRGATLFYEPDVDEAKLLSYARNDVQRSIREVVLQYRSPAA